MENTSKLYSTPWILYSSYYGGHVAENELRRDLLAKDGYLNKRISGCASYKVVRPVDHD